jgi:hypothetical protein
MTLTPEVKQARKRERMIEKAKDDKISPAKYAKRSVAPTYQKMVRAEAGADPRPFVTAIVDGEIAQVARQSGQCVCISCGKVGPWKGNYYGGGVFDTGHYVAGRCLSILFEPTNSHPQCKHCNKTLSGNQGCYTTWMRFTYGQDEIDRLNRQVNETGQFTLGELVDMKMGYQIRLQKAITLMEKGEHNA